MLSANAILNLMNILNNRVVGFYSVFIVNLICAAATFGQERTAIKEFALRYPLVNLERIGIAIDQAIAPGLLSPHLEGLDSYNVTMVVLNGKLQSLSLECKVGSEASTLNEILENWGSANAKSLLRTESSSVFGASASGRKVGVLIEREDDCLRICFTHIVSFRDFSESMKQAYDDAVALERSNWLGANSEEDEKDGQAF